MNIFFRVYLLLAVALSSYASQPLVLKKSTDHFHEKSSAALPEESLDDLQVFDCVVGEVGISVAEELLVGKTDVVAVVEDQSEEGVQGKVEDFLFTYFGVDLVFKELPRDLQYLISRQLVNLNLIVVPLVYKEPHRCHQLELDDAPYVRNLAFTGNDSHITVLVRKKAVEVDLDFSADDTPKTKKVGTYAFPRFTLGPYIYLIEYSDDNTRVAITDSSRSVCELTIENNEIAQREVLSVVADHFDQDDQYNKEVILEGKECKLPFNCIKDMQYLPTGELVIATSFKEVLIVSKDRKSLEAIQDSQQPFNPAKKVYAYYTPSEQSEGKLGVKPAAMNLASISRKSSKAFFGLSEGLVMCDYKKGTYTTLIEENPQAVIYSLIVSPDGKFLALSYSDSRLKGSCMRLFAIKDDNMIEVGPIAYELTTSVAAHIVFSPDSRFLILQQMDNYRVFHVNTLNCIAILETGSIFEKFPHSTYSKTGDYLAILNNSKWSVGHEKRFAKFGCSSPEDYFSACSSRPKECFLEVWKHDPLWSELSDLYEGHLLLEEAMLIAFLYSNVVSKKSFNVIADEYNITVDSLKKYLKGIYEKIANGPLKRYINKRFYIDTLLGLC